MSHLQDYTSVHILPPVWAMWLLVQWNISRSGIHYVQAEVVRAVVCFSQFSLPLQWQWCTQTGTDPFSLGPIWEDNVELHGWLMTCIRNKYCCKSLRFCSCLLMQITQQNLIICSPPHTGIDLKLITVLVPMHRSSHSAGNLHKSLIFAFGSLSLDFHHLNYSVVQVPE